MPMLGNARLTCRYYGITAQTFYRWKRRFDPYDLTTLDEISRRPHHVPRLKTSDFGPDGRKKDLAVKRTVSSLGQGKAGGSAQAGRDHHLLGATVGRVMSRLRARGLLVEPENVRQAKLARQRRRKPLLCHPQAQGLPGRWTG